MAQPLSSGPRPAEERSYLLFMAGGLAFALGAGLVLAVLIPLAARVPGAGARLPDLVQAHGWAQLQGFVGLVTAGMGMRLLPRLCGRRPLPPALTLPVFGLLLSAAGLRVSAQALLDGTGRQLAMPAAGVLGGAGLAVVAATFALTLLRSRRPGQGWRLPAWAAAGWWATWALLAVIAGILGRTGGPIPQWFDAPTTWVVLLGAVGNLVWTVQARSVPVFYGRRPPGVRAIAAPLALFNLGAGVVLVSVLAGGDLPRRLGLALAGLAMLRLAPLCGAVGGSAHRLHPASRPPAAFVVAANRWALVAGGLLLLALVLTLAGAAGPAAGFEDGALHAIGLGLVTMLIPGVARLLAPVFAIERTGAAARSTRPWASDPGVTLVFGALMAATTLRVLAAVADGAVAQPWTGILVAAAGSLAWLGLLLFAAGFIRAWLRQRGLAARLRRDALAKRP